jgi:methylated-DNA-[protein]-cysteine S-methyltransferase
MIRYSIFKTLFGWMGVVEGGEGLKKIVLPLARRAEVEKNIFQEFPDSEENKASLRLLADILAKYFKGEKITQCFPFDVAGYTEFLVTVWKTTQTIPWGEVRSYQWVSTHIKKPGSFRAVGNALGRNPFPIVVPCHRVIRSDGTIGGFSASGGVLLKQRMLRLEGVVFDRQGRVMGFKNKAKNRERTPR